MSKITLSNEYRSWLKGLKQQIQGSQIKAALSVNSQLISLYFDMGRQVTEKQEQTKWGSGFMEQLSRDLQAEFPGMTGLSAYNLRFMKTFFKFWEQAVPKTKDKEFPFQQTQKNQIIQEIKTRGNVSDIILEQSVPKLALIPWGHHILLLKKCKELNQAIFYINKTVENNWSRSVLEYQIETNLYNRQGKAVNNFSFTLPKPQSDLAHALLKDPYSFQFLQLSEEVKEVELEKALVKHITQFLTELGIGFAYMGRQFLLKVGQKEYCSDLLFYHTKLKCYVVIELKTKAFEPEYAGKLNFYITALNELVKQADDKPTIGILLCKDKDSYEVEFALKDIRNPIGVSTYHYAELSEEIRAVLPSAELLQKELSEYEQSREGK
ncbi:putative nuclease YhcG [compost metagenome]